MTGHEIPQNALKISVGTISIMNDLQSRYRAESGQQKEPYNSFVLMAALEAICNPQNTEAQQKADPAAVQWIKQHAQKYGIALPSASQNSQEVQDSSSQVKSQSKAVKMVKATLTGIKNVLSGEYELKKAQSKKSVNQTPATQQATPAQEPTSGTTNKKSANDIINEKMAKAAASFAELFPGMKVETISDKDVPKPPHGL